MAHIGALLTCPMPPNVAAGTLNIIITSLITTFDSNPNPSDYCRNTYGYPYNVLYIVTPLRPNVERSYVI